MNVYLFIQSLSDDEKEELKSYFLKEKIAKEKEENYKIINRIPIREFAYKYDFSNRIITALLREKEKFLGNELVNYGYYFKYADEITKREFLKMPQVGIKAWKIVEKALSENNIAIK